MSTDKKTLKVKENVAQSIGIKVQSRNTPILAQAIGGTLIQALYAAFNEFGSQPDTRRAAWSFAQSSEPFFDVGVQITAVGNQTGRFMLTNSRIVTVLSLLGFEFSNQNDLSDLTEYDFDVVIDTWQKPEVVIAQGSLANTLVRPIPLVNGTDGGGVSEA